MCLIYIDTEGFNNDDYLKLSNYNLYQEEGLLLNDIYSININHLTFIKVKGFINENRNSIMFSMVYDENFNAILLPTDNLKSFCEAYNKLIENRRFIAYCSSQKFVRNYICFLIEILWPDTFVNILNIDNITYNKQNQEISVGNIVTTHLTQKK